MEAQNPLKFAAGKCIKMVSQNYGILCLTLPKQVNGGRKEELDEKVQVQLKGRFYLA